MKRKQVTYWRDKSKRVPIEIPFLRSIRSEVTGAMGIYADWLDDQERENEAEAWRLLHARKFRPRKFENDFLWYTVTDDSAVHTTTRPLPHILPQHVFSLLKAKSVICPSCVRTSYRKRFNALADFVQAWVAAAN